MLIVSRRFGQSVVIGEEVLCSVVGICGNQVRLAFEAPKDIPISYKNEMVQQMIAERRYATAQKNMDEKLISFLTQRLKNNSNAA